jgi:hypothetical protein
MAQVALFAMLLLVGILATPLSASADTWGEPITPASDRFVVLNSFDNQAVYDKETGLIWEQSPLSPCVPAAPLFMCIVPESGKRIWDFAHGRCRDLHIGGRMAWRLPTIEELATLLDRNQLSAPFLPPGNPFIGVQPRMYWSSTTSAINLNDALGVDFGGGKFVTDVGDKNGNQNFVWCVRGGSGINPQ